MTLDEVERRELIRALEQCVIETHDEKRHADSAPYHDQVAGDESRLQTLLKRIRRLAQDGQAKAAVIKQARCACD